MNFFEHQDRARGTTRRLVLLFALAVASLIVVTTLLVVFALGLAGQAATEGAPGLPSSVLVSQVFLVVAILVLGIVLLGALFRVTQLRGGGRVVAEGLGGRLLRPGTRDADERKVLNVVDEMAIAAGVPVPPVYLLDDPAINAFAAGWAQEDAVIGITRGCIQALTRDELQGVVAHEFSHVFNGDMRLNIRLMAWLYGIMVIGMIGYYVLRGSRYTWSAGRRKNGGGILLLAAGLVVIGYGGTFFGNLIKAAVSRQREFLADASAVQYTRNPAGIAGALKKIAAQGDGAMLQADVSEVSHMLFAQGLKAGFTGLFATHPPLEQRIRRIEPGWNGSLKAPDPGHARAAGTQAEAGQSPQSAAGRDRDTALHALATAVVASVGEPGAGHLALAAEELASLPAGLREELQDPLGAMLLMLALLLAPEGEPRARQLAVLRAGLEPAQLSQLLALLPALDQVARGQRLTLVELAVPALKALSDAQLQGLVRQMQALISSDGDICLFEWSVSRLLRQQLQPASKPAGRRLQLQHCSAAVSQLLAALAQAGHSDATAVGEAFAAGKELLGLPLTLLPAMAALDPRKLDQALRQLQLLQPLQKPRLLKAMVACVAQDGRLEPAESDLLRVTALLLDCPLPPLPRLSR